MVAIMIEISLNKYNNKDKYLDFFEAHIKASSETKASVFTRLKISKATFRRLKGKDTIRKDEILTSLSKYYKITIETNSIFKELEDLVNRVYNSAYYMNFDSFSLDIKTIDKRLKKSGVLSPVLKLLKLFLIVCKYNTTAINSDVKALYEEVMFYSSFFEDELQSILSIISLLINDKRIDVTCESNNPLYLQMLATKYAREGMYYEALYNAEMAKEAFEKEMNFRRLIVVNRTIIYSQLCLKHYQDAYDKSKYQRACVRTFSKDQYDVEITNGYYYISMLGLKMYDKIIDCSYKVNELNKYEYICYLISLYKTDISKYNSQIEELDDYVISLNDKMEIVNIIDYLNTKNNSILDNLKNMEFNKPLLMILEEVI